jgi:D-tyrosyl-tRNA(Tyr) deacylase
MNLSLLDVAGKLLVVSQFTLYGDCRKGRRPGFSDSAPGDRAQAMYDRFIVLAKEKGVQVESGRFGATMDVDLVNDGPVTLLLDSKKEF